MLFTFQRTDQWASSSRMHYSMHRLTASVMTIVTYASTNYRLTLSKTKPSEFSSITSLCTRVNTVDSKDLCCMLMRAILEFC